MPRFCVIFCLIFKYEYVIELKVAWSILHAWDYGAGFMMTNLDYDFIVLGGGPIGLYTFWRLKNRFPLEKIVLIDGSKYLSTLVSETIVKTNVNYQGNEIRHSLGRHENSSTWGGAMMIWPRTFSLASSFNTKEVNLDLDSFYDIVCKNLNLDFPIDSQMVKIGNTDYCFINAEILKNLNFNGFVSNDDKLELKINNIFYDEYGSLSIDVYSSSDQMNSRLSCRKIFLCLGTLENTRLLLSSPVINNNPSKHMLGRNLTDHLSLSLGFFNISPFKRKLRKFLKFSNSQNTDFWPRLLDTTNFPECDYFLHFRIDNPELSSGSVLFRILNKLRITFGFHRIESLVFFEKIKDENTFIKLHDGKLEINFYTSGKDLDTYRNIALNSMANIEKFFNVCFLTEPEWIQNEESMLNYLTDTLHPAGTISLTDDFVNGILNQNLCLNSTDNIYIFGSSVFPRSSATHPTLTALALAEMAISSVS